MVSENDNRLSFPTRPKFLWDINAVPWTEGMGDQLMVAKTARRSFQFHDNLSDSNGNKIKKKNLGLVLFSHLYGRAANLCEEIEDPIVEA